MGCCAAASWPSPYKMKMCDRMCAECWQRQPGSFFWRLRWPRLSGGGVYALGRVRYLTAARGWHHAVPTSVTCPHPGMEATSLGRQNFLFLVPLAGSFSALPFETSTVAAVTSFSAEYHRYFCLRRS